MVSFRRIILALAVLALFTGLASAQVTGGGSTGSTLTCAANVANPLAARAEGYAELLGDIVIQCSGGLAPAQGSLVPTANITVALNNTIVTSRILQSSTNLSEALLLIDEPGTATSTGAGTTLPQVLCGGTVGAGPGGCVTYADVATAGVSRASTCSAVSNGVCTSFSGSTTPNVFQGIVQGNQVIFNGIPILAPVTAGAARVFRITNVRGNAAQLANLSGTFQGQTPIQASITISNVVLLQNPLQTVAYLFNGLAGTSVRNAANDGGGTSISIAQCGTAGITRGATLRFTEGFANAFKTRVAPTATYSGAATPAGSIQAVGTFSQNVPGTIYNGSESGFIFPIGSANAGLADFGTRLKAVFNNIPANVNIYVSTTNINSNGQNGGTAPLATNTSVNNVPVNTTSSLLAGLVVGETAGASTLGSFLPLQPGNANSGGFSIFGPLQVDPNGTAVAVWEILTTNPAQAELADFAVFYSFAGDPANNRPPTSPAGTVTMSFAPTFTSPTASSLIPRFTPAINTPTLVTVNLCQTTLMYPFVSSEPGFDTGLAIANTSTDPFGTRAQSGTCKLNFFGTGTGTTTTVTTPVVQSGRVYAEQASTLMPGFRGYVIAVCDFQLAHGYALFSDTGIRNWATGYLALVVSTGTGARNTDKIAYAPATTGVEGGIH